MFEEVDVEAIQAKVEALVKKHKESIVSSQKSQEAINLKQQLPPPNNDCSIFVKNLDPTVQKSDLQEFFSVCGEIVRTTPIVDPYTLNTKFAYIEFQEEEAAINALRLNDRIFKGKNLEIFLKKDVPPNQTFRRRKRRRIYRRRR